MQISKIRTFDHRYSLDVPLNFQRALGNLGHVFEMEGNYAEVVEFYEKSLAVSPDSEELRFQPEVIEVVKEHLQKAREKASGK